MPDLGSDVPDRASDAYPRIEPIEGLIVMAIGDGTPGARQATPLAAVADPLAARINALRARAALLRGAPISDETRARLAGQ